MRVLLAEDDDLLGSGLRAGLRQQGFQVDWVRDGHAAELELLSGNYMAAVLDLGLPRQDGMQVIASLRTHKNTTPILVLTARDAVSARIGGLYAGADDYLVKPIDLHELAARLRALSRQPHKHAHNTLKAGRVELVPEAHFDHRTCPPKRALSAIPLAGHSSQCGCPCLGHHGHSHMARHRA